MLLNSHVTCSSIFHAYILFLSTLNMCFRLFSLSLSLSRIDCVMAPKQRKSTSTWNSLHGFGSSFSDPSVPSYIRFRDEKAKTKHQVIMLDFSNTMLLDVIQTREWESLCEKPVRCPVVFIQEFYSNIHGIDISVPQFVSIFRGTHIVVTPNLISEVLRVPRVAHPDYPGCDCLQIVSKDKLISHFCGTPSV